MGAGGMADCTMQGCAPNAYCGYVSQDGRVDVLQCLPYPSGCNDCTCATAALGAYYVAHFPCCSLPPCTCTNTSGTLVVSCTGA
jgi:hypothetical protein